MGATTEVIEFDGALLQRGFWLYVWQVTEPGGGQVLYVGRTGDSSSPHAQSPFVRMGQHLGFQKNSSMLRTHLGHRGVDPARCTYRMFAHGPVLPEVPSGEMGDHKIARDRVAAIEHRLEKDLSDAGYAVLNTVTSKAPLDAELYVPVLAAFAEHLPRLTSVS